MSAAKAATPAETEGAPPPKSKKGLFIALGLALAGLLLGGGGASAYFLLLHPADKAAVKEAAEEIVKAPPEYVEIDRMLVSLLDQDGKLLTYLSLDLTLEVEAKDLDYVNNRLPLVRHAVNEAFSMMPMAAKNKGSLDFEKASKTILKLSNEALGQPAVVRVDIVNALPM
jgi:flagellar basal body-associated protein FliL